MLRRVARSATYTRMFPIQNVSRFGVIKSGRGRIPVDHLKSRAVVVGVAFHTRSTLRAWPGESGMKSAVLLNLRIDFAMTLKAPELGRSR